MDRFDFAYELAKDLDDVEPNKKFDFMRRKLRDIPDLRYRNDIEKAILTYLENGQLDAIGRPHTVCVTLHGIRTHGEWQEKLKLLLDQNYDNIKTEVLSFGFKDVFTFIFPVFLKSRAKEYIKRQIDDLLPEYRSSIRILVAHSFGTFIVANLLKSNPTYEFDRVILCGSIVPEKFDWETLKNFPKGGLINDCGSEDIWPVLAKAGGTDYGDSGISGFTSHKVDDRYHKCGHDGFFDDDFMETFWLPFIADGHKVSSLWGAKKPSKKYIYSLLTLTRGTLIYLSLPVFVLAYYCFFY